MKILVVENAYMSAPANEPSLVVYPDTSLLRNNDPFFIPDLSRKVLVRAGLVLKVDKIGKCIAPQFAERYYSHVGIAFDFVQSDMQKELNDKRLNTGPAVYFDKSFAVSNDFIEKETFEKFSGSYCVKFNDTQMTLSSKSARFNFTDAISSSSNYFTIKIGDLVYIPAISFDKGVKQGDVIDGVFNNQIIVRCNIK